MLAEMDGGATSIRQKQKRDKLTIIGLIYLQIIYKNLKKLGFKMDQNLEIFPRMCRMKGIEC